MPVKIVVPDLGESVVEATVSRWLKQEGERVTVGEPLVSLETDKVDLEIGAQQDGVLTRIDHPEGDDVKIGDVLGEIEDAPAEPGLASGADGKGKERIPPQEAHPEEIQESQVAPAVQAPPVEDTLQDAERVTPVARRVAQDLGVDLDQVQGSGPGGRITKMDIERHQGQPAASVPSRTPGVIREPASQKQTPSEHTQQPASTSRPDELVERQRMSRRRRTIAQRLLEAQQSTAMLTTFNDVDMSAVMDLRSRRKESFKEKHGVGLGIVSFFVKASIGALKAYPRLNAEIQGEEILLKRYYDIGVAIGAEEGLVVPVLRDADRLTFASIENAIQGFVQKSRDGTLTLEDLRGGTFTITNGGVFGSLLSTPILNPPQVGILGLHRIENRPVAIGNEVAIRPMMYLALSYDHRIVDGREAVQFLVRIKELIEDPERLLLES